MIKKGVLKSFNQDTYLAMRVTEHTRYLRFENPGRGDLAPTGCS